jgi:hypothetical protein
VSRLPDAMRAIHVTALLGFSLAASAAAPPSPADLAHCAAIAAPDARLACYDALTGAAGRAPSAAPAPAPTTPGAASTPAPSRAGATPAPAALPASPPPGPGDARDFGLSQAQLHPLPVGPNAIEARITKVVNTLYGRNSVLLDNGQTWTYTDSDQDARLAPGDPVTIQRASIGSFLMKTPSRHAYHVRRTQ